MLMGAGTPPASISFQSGAGVLLSVYDFGPTEVQVGSMSPPVTVFVRNIGMVGTGMLATVLAGTNPGDFAIVDGFEQLRPLACRRARSARCRSSSGRRWAARARRPSPSSRARGGVTSLLLKGPGVEVSSSTVRWPGWMNG